MLVHTWILLLGIRQSTYDIKLFHLIFIFLPPHRQGIAFVNLIIGFQPSQT